MPRLHVYVRKLVQAGHKVGIVRQTETAAIKSQSSNRNAPFTRQLTAVYTRATLEVCSTCTRSADPLRILCTQAGALDDVGHQGEGGSRDGGGWSNHGLSAYLVVVAEGGGETGACAVETSTGDVYYALFRYVDTMHSVCQSTRGWRTGMGSCGNSSVRVLKTSPAHK